MDINKAWSKKDIVKEILRNGKGRYRAIFNFDPGKFKEVVKKGYTAGAKFGYKNGRIDLLKSILNMARWDKEEIIDYVDTELEKERE